MTAFSKVKVMRCKQHQCSNWELYQLTRASTSCLVWSGCKQVERESKHEIHKTKKSFNRSSKKLRIQLPSHWLYSTLKAFKLMQTSTCRMQKRSPTVWLFFSRQWSILISIAYSCGSQLVWNWSCLLKVRIGKTGSFWLRICPRKAKWSQLMRPQSTCIRSSQE